MLTLIVARGRDGAIGRAGDIPWRAPEDLKAFQKETRGGAVIMGRNTWLSLPVRPLKDRLNIVVTRDTGLHDHTVPDIGAALSLAADMGYDRVYGIGGAGIYKEMLPLAQRLLITEVEISVPGADTYFPDFEESSWEVQAQEVLRDMDPRCIQRDLRRK